MTISKDMIAAYADGELEGEALRLVEAALAADPALRAEVDAHRALKARLCAHFAPIAETPVPERLIRAVKGGAEVVDFAAVARKPARPAPMRFAWFGPALAASLVVALVGYGVSQRSGNDYAVGDLAAALDHQLVATQPTGAPVRILLSFRGGKGQFCRGFSSALQAGVACRDGRGWKLVKRVGGGSAETSEYRQAGSTDAEVLSAIQDIAQGPALDAQGERNAMGAGWRTE
jgi:hypothetical protein